MSDITALVPTSVWTFFDQITKIPRPSKKEEQIIAFLVEFAKEAGLDCHKDSVGNVLIRKPAYPGCEEWPGVILQSHMDMVCEKNSEVNFDFEKDPIRVRIDEGWVKAEGTTLGADCGIGMAAQLAVLAAKDIQHGPIECLFTVDEETGLTGAFGLSDDLLTGKYLINLDSEDEGQIFIGCAGGVNTLADFKYRREELPKNYEFFRIDVSGLVGGHSGDDIDKGRANSNKIMARWLDPLTEEFGMRLVYLDGGNLKNAIPREADVILTIPADNEEELLELVKYCEDLFNEEYHAVETPISFKAERVDLPKGEVPEEIQDNLVDAIFACQNGICRMIPTIPDTVETSSNLSIITIEEGKAQFSLLIRSSSESMKEYLATSLESCFSMAGMKVELSGSYSGWNPDVESPILKAMVQSYKEQFGNEPAVKVVHAGLECGIIGSIIPGLDMISFGPTLRSPHSPDERVYVPSVKKFYEFLVATLGNTPKKTK